MTESQIDSYKQLQSELGEKQKKIYDAMKLLGDCTYVDVCNHLNAPTNSVTPRITELYNRGWLDEVGERFNDATKRYNTVYRVRTEKGKEKHRLSHILSISKDDAVKVLNCEDIVTKNYSFAFKGTLATIEFAKIELMMSDCVIIDANDKSELIIINDGSRLRIPIV